MRGEYTLEPLAYGVCRKVVQLVEIIEYPSAKYMGKDIANMTGLINRYTGSRGQLMDPREVQKDSHTSETRKKIQRTNFVHIYLFSRLFNNQE